MKLIVIILVVTFSFGLFSCTDWSLHSVKSIETVNGQKIYFKREVRGINGNYDVIAISTNGNPCRSYNKETDYCICNSSQAVYYNINGNILTLYNYSIPQHAPTKSDFPVSVEGRQVSQIFTENTEKIYQEKGIQKLDLEIDKTIKCW